jgi:hypothetical protein
MPCEPSHIYLFVLVTVGGGAWGIYPQGAGTRPHTDLDGGIAIVVDPSRLPPIGTHRTRYVVLGQAKP